MRTDFAALAATGSLEAFRVIAGACADLGAHFGFVGPLPVQSLLQYVDRGEAEIDYSRGRLDFSVA
jgi:hypothetical protein